MTTISPGESTPNIQTKINAAPSGDVVEFSGQTTITTALSITKPLKFVFKPGSVVSNRGLFYQFLLRANGCSFTGGGTLDGTLIAVVDGAISDTTIDGLTFKCFNNGGTIYGNNSAGILHTHSINNWRIRNVSFIDIQGLAAIYGFHWVNPIVENCLFRSKGDGGRPTGIKWDGKSASVTDAIIRSNLFSGLRGMGVEFQTRHVRTIIEDNYYEKPVLLPGPRRIINGKEIGPNDDVFAFSTPWDADGTVGCIIRRNYFDCGDTASIGDGVRNLIEGGGHGTIIEENYFKEGTSYWVGIDITHGNSDGVIRNNWLAGRAKTGHNIRGAGARWQQSGNSSTKPAVFGWDVNRPKPGPGTPGPVDPPAPTIAVGATPNADGSLSLAWTTSVAGPYTLSAKTSNGGDPVKVIGTTPDKSVVLIDGHSGWEYTITTTSGSASGSVKVRVAGDPTAPGPVNELKIRTGTPPTDDVAELKKQLAEAEAEIIRLQGKITAGAASAGKLQQDLLAP